MSLGSTRICHSFICSIREPIIANPEAHYLRPPHSCCATWTNAALDAHAALASPSVGWGAAVQSILGVARSVTLAALHHPLNQQGTQSDRLIALYLAQGSRVARCRSLSTLERRHLKYVSATKAGTGGGGTNQLVAYAQLQQLRMQQTGDSQGACFMLIVNLRCKHSNH